MLQQISKWKIDPSDVDICGTKTTAFITTMLGYLSWNQTGFRVQKIFFTSSLRRVMHSTKTNQGLKEDFLRIWNVAWKLGYIRWRDELKLIAGKWNVWMMYSENNIEYQFYLQVMNFFTRGNSCEKFKNTFYEKKLWTFFRYIIGKQYWLQSDWLAEEFCYVPSSASN